MRPPWESEEAAGRCLEADDGAAGVAGAYTTAVGPARAHVLSAAGLGAVTLVPEPGADFRVWLDGELVHSSIGAGREPSFCSMSSRTLV